jgi:hypothetical protein
MCGCGNLYFIELAAYERKDKKMNDVQFDINNPIYEVIEQCDPQIHNH